MVRATTQGLPYETKSVGHIVKPQFIVAIFIKIAFNFRCFAGILRIRRWWQGCRRVG